MITDLVNYSIILAIISYLTLYRKLDLKIALALAITSSAPFFLIGVFIPIGLLSDVITFTIFSQHYRAELGLHPDIPEIVWNSLQKHEDSPVSLVSQIYTMVPLPFIDTFKSIGFFNRLVFILFIAFLVFRKNQINNNIIFFLILYPSIILYTNLPLRDNLILLSIILITILSIENKYIRSLPIIYFLYLLRPVNGIIMLVVSSLYFFYISVKGRLSKSIMFIILLIIFFIINLLFFDQIIEAVNNYKVARAEEDRIDPKSLAYAGSFFQFVFSILISIPKFFLYPFPWESTSLFMLIQSIENILMLLIIIYLFFSTAKIGFLKSIFWIACLIFIGGLYGYVQSNVGALVRYKFVFYAMYVCAVMYEVQKLNVGDEEKLNEKKSIG